MNFIYFIVFVGQPIMKRMFLLVFFFLIFRKKKETQKVILLKSPFFSFKYQDIFDIDFCLTYFGFRKILGEKKSFFGIRMAGDNLFSRALFCCSRVELTNL